MRRLLNRIEASPLASRLASGVIWSTLGTVVSRGLMLAAFIIVARMLGKASYGELGIIRSTVGMFGVFAGLGLGLTATKHVAEFRERDPERAGRILSLSMMFALLSGLLLATLLFVSAPWLAAVSLDAPHLAGPLRIGAVFILLSSVNGAQTGALSGLEAFKAIAVINFCIGILSFPIVVCGTYLGGLSGAMWALVASLGINLVVNNNALRVQTRRFGIQPRRQSCMSELPVLWRYSLPAVLAGALVGPVDWICCAFLANRPGGYSELGLFSAANQWFALLLFVPGTLSQVLLPLVATQLGQNGNSNSVKLLKYGIATNLIMVVPVAIFACLFSPFIMGLYGPSFQEGWPTLVVVLLTAVLVAAQTPVGQMIAASGNLWVGFAMNLGWAVVFITATYFLVNRGALGLSSARAFAYLVHATWVSAYTVFLLRNSSRHESLLLSPTL